MKDKIIEYINDSIVLSVRSKQICFSSRCGHHSIKPGEYALKLVTGSYLCEHHIEHWKGGDCPKAYEVIKRCKRIERLERIKEQSER